MMELIIIDELAPFTQEDFEKAAKHIKKETEENTAERWIASGQWTGKGVSSAILKWYGTTQGKA